MIGDKKEVYFEQYCPKCEHLNDSEDDPKSPCWDCVAEPAAVDSNKPLYFKEASENEKQSNCKDHGKRIG